MTEDRLRQLVRDYFCVVDQSRMSDAIEQMLRAHSARLPVTFCGHPSHNMTEIRSVASQIGLSWAVDTSATDPGRQRTVADSTLPIYVPRDSERLDDIEKLLTFYFQKHVAELGNAPGVSVHSIEYLFLPWLVSTLSSEPAAELDQMVRNAILRSKNGTVGIDSIAGPSDNVVNALLASLTNTPDAACRYVGCEMYEEVRDLPLSFPNHRLNEAARAAQRHYEETEGESDLHLLKSMPDMPLVRRVLIAHPDDIGVIALNFMFYSKPGNWPREEKVRTCLNLRLCGQTEKQICAELGYLDFDTYLAWLIENHIDIQSREKPVVFERWKLAKDELFGSNPQTIVEKVHVPPHAESMVKRVWTAASKLKAVLDDEDDLQHVGSESVSARETALLELVDAVRLLPYEWLSKKPFSSTCWCHKLDADHFVFVHSRFPDSGGAVHVHHPIPATLGAFCHTVSSEFKRSYRRMPESFLQRSYPN